MRAAKFLTIAFIMAFVSPAFAADEFGDRFSQQAPAGLSDDTMIQANQEAADAAAMQNIEPAAGDAAVNPLASDADNEALSDEAEAGLEGNAVPAAETPGQ